MKIRTILAFLAISLFIMNNGLYAQEEQSGQPNKVKFSSVIVDADANPIKGAVIYANEGAVTYITGEDGRFSFEIAPEGVILIEKEGYQTITFPVVDTKLPESFTLIESPVQLGETDEVYIPFGSIKARSNASSIYVLDPDDIYESDNQVDINGALRGRVPGMFGNRNIHGLGNALYVVDGVPRDASLLNIQEVEQITVLKDAPSRLLYGAQADRPVILITTKHGLPNKRAFRVNVESGIMNPVSYPEYLDAASYMELYNEALANDGKLPKYSDEAIENTRAGVDPVLYPDEEYYSSFYLKNNKSFYNLSAEGSGGNEIATYYAFLGWNGENSLMALGRGEKNDRFNIRGNVKYNINDYISMSFKGLAAFNVNKSLNGNFWSNSTSLLPNLYPVLIPVEDSALLQSTSAIDGQYVLGGTNEYQTNIYGDLVRAGYRDSYSRTLQVNTRLDFDLSFITEGLKASANLSADLYSFYRTRLLNEYAVYEPQVVDGMNGDSVSLIKHGLDVKAGRESLNIPDFYRRLGFFGTLNYHRIFNDMHDVGFIGVAYRDQLDQNGEIHQVRNLNYGFLLNYTMSRKYILQAAGSYAGSPAFSLENRYIFTPAVSAGWVISEESFFPGNGFIKLKASYGVIGSDGDMDNSYAYRDNFSLGNTFYYNNRTSYNNISYFSTIGNPALSWERRNELSAGAEMGFFDGGLWVDVAYFNSTKSDIITRRTNSYPDYLGVIPFDNYNSYTYSGVDLNISGHKNVGEFGLDIGVNLSYINSSWNQYDELDYEEDYLSRIGNPVNSMFGWVADGFYTEADFDAEGNLNEGLPVPTFGSVQPGDIKYQNLNNDEFIDDNDRKIIGNGDPALELGMNINLRYKSFELFVLGTGQIGESLFFNNPYYWVYGERKYPAHITTRWTPQTAETATYPRLSSTDNSNNFRNSTFWLYDNNWFTLHTVQLSWKLPRVITNKSFIKGFKLYARGTNLLTISAIKDKKELNIGSEPQFRNYSIGVNASF